MVGYTSDSLASCLSFWPNLSIPMANSRV